MTKPRIVFLIILGLILILAIVSYHLWLSPAALKSNVKSILGQYFNAEITLGSASFSPRSGLELKGLRMTKAPERAVIFKSSKLVIRPDLLSLFKLRFQIKELCLQNAVLDLSKGPEGKSNWATTLKEQPASRNGTIPSLGLENGKIKIANYTFQGINCELTPFPSENLLAIQGNINDPFWGRYTFTGKINTKDKIIRLSFEGYDLVITEAWVRNFPAVGNKVWERYRPAGLFDLTGSINYYIEESSRSNFNLIFTGKDSSCKYLIFPVNEATGRVLIDRSSVIVNNLNGELFKGYVEGYSIVNMDAPYTYFNHYRFTDVDMAEFLKDFQTKEKSLQGTGSGYASFHGDHSLGTFRGKGELTIPNARLWKFPVILQILSKLQLKLWQKEEPTQECRIIFSFSEKGINLKEFSLVSDVFDIYGVGKTDYDGSIKLNFYVRPVSKTPILLADLFLQPAFDTLSGNLAQFEVTGTVQKPKLKIIPLTPVSDQITNFFDGLTKKRFRR